MANDEKTQRPEVLRELAKRRGLTQKQIADAVGISQSQVSRVLSGESQKRSAAMHIVCRFVEDVPGDVTAERVRQNDELMEALAFTWDGTAQHSAALAAVIRALRVLVVSSASISGTTQE